MNTYKVGNFEVEYDKIEDNILLKFSHKQTVLKEVDGQLVEVEEDVYEEVLTLNRYVFDFNDDDYIIGAEKTESDTYDWYGQISVFEQAYGADISYGCYKLEDGEVVFDENKYNEIVAQREQERREKEIEDAKPQAQLLYTALMTDTLLPED